MLARVKGSLFYVFVTVLAVGCFVIGATLGGEGVTAAELQEKLITACENSRSPLQTFFSSELEESERRSISELQAAFPEFPPEEIRRSIIAKRTNLRTLLATYDPAKCDDQYR